MGPAKAHTADCAHRNTGAEAHLDVRVEEQLVGAVGKPQSLNVLYGLDVVQHSVGSNEVDSEAQSCPP